jgi:hypothetical protein
MRTSHTCLILFAFFAVATTTSAAIPSGERLALISLFNSTHGEHWIANTNWCAGGTCDVVARSLNDPGTECDWFGVTCDASGAHVSKLALASNNLVGVMPPEVSMLCGLETMNVANNLLQGTIPSFVCAIHLRTLVLHANHFSGVIPDLSANTELTTFVVSNNFLTGALPSLGGLSHLQTFDVQRNAIGGSLPALSPTHDGTALTNLRSFLVAHNEIEGAIPELDGLESLALFDVGDNKVSGIVPRPSEYLVATGLANLCPNQLSYPSVDPTIEAAWTDIYAYREQVPFGTPWWQQCDVLFQSGLEQP